MLQHAHVDNLEKLDFDNNLWQDLIDLLAADIVV
jgi:hypothetical protein